MKKNIVKPLFTLIAVISLSGLSFLSGHSTNVIAAVEEEITLNVPANIMNIEATRPTGAIVNYPAVNGYDFVEGANLVKNCPVWDGNYCCTRDSGETYAIGTTTVTCTGQSYSGNFQKTKSFTITVQDTTAPNLMIPSSINVETTDAAGIEVNIPATADDLVDGTRPVTCTPASDTIFPVGNTTVTCSASDTHGNTATKSFVVSVTKTEVAPQNRIPSLSISASKTSITTAESSTITAVISGGDTPNTLSWNCTNGKTDGNVTSITFNSTTAGTFTCTAKVTDNNGDSASQNVTITVTAPATTPTPTPTPSTTTTSTTPSTNTTTETKETSSDTQGEVLSADDTNKPSAEIQTETQVKSLPFIEQYWWVLVLFAIAIIAAASYYLFVVSKKKSKKEDTTAKAK